MDNAWYEGDTTTWTNGTGADVSSGDMVVVGGVVGVASVDIADGLSGTVRLRQVYSLPKTAALAISQGAKVYFDDVAKEINLTDTNTYAGIAHEAAADVDSEVLVNINF